MVGEFQEVEGTAVLTIITREMLTLLRWFEEMLLVGEFTCYKGMVVDQSPEQKFRCLSAIFCTKHLIVSRLTQEFRDEGIGMVGAEVVVTILQWVYLLVMIEILCHPEILLILGQGIEFVHRLIETAKLIADHLLSSLL